MLAAMRRNPEQSSPPAPGAPETVMLRRSQRRAQTRSLARLQANGLRVSQGAQLADCSQAHKLRHARYHRLR